MSYDDKGEKTREFYRRQGEDRERERIFFALKQIQEMRRAAAERTNAPYSQTISFAELEIILNENR